MPEKIVAFKVDVDTYAGTRDGVPNLLSDMADFGVKATYYFSMGPDNSGKAIRRIFTRKGFLAKMLRTKAPAAYGLKTMLYGTLLPAPMISASFPDILRMTAQKGHLSEASLSSMEQPQHANFVGGQLISQDVSPGA